VDFEALLALGAMQAFATRSGALPALSTSSRTLRNLQ
jgi:hypothetical protein